MKKVVNLADKQEVLELLKTLYTLDKDCDNDKSFDTNGDAGTKSPGSLAELPPQA